MRRSLLWMLLVPSIAWADPRDRSAASALPALENTAAWRHLPPAKHDAGLALPIWARMLAEPLPRTTAAMIQLDAIHRARSPLDPRLRAWLRWIIADANRCEYSRQTAQFDLQRAGGDTQVLSALRENKGEAVNWPNAHWRTAGKLVRDLTIRAADVSDGQFAQVLDAFGEPRTVAIVLLTAAANFQDRLFLALGVPLEPDGPLPPATFEFDSEVAEEDLPQAPERDRIDTRSYSPDPNSTKLVPANWNALRWDELQRLMVVQKARSPRIRIPTRAEYEESVKRIPRPKGAKQSARPTRIVWSIVCSGYQPELAAAWSACTSAFRMEAKQDRVFEESLFWVVTRSIDCFY